MGQLSFDEAVAYTAEWEERTTGEPLDGKLGIPVRRIAKYAVSQKWVTNGRITIIERAGQQRSFTMSVDELHMKSPTRYAVSGVTDCGHDMIVVFDLRFQRDQNGAGFAAYWPTDLSSDEPSS